MEPVIDYISYQPVYISCFRWRFRPPTGFTRDLWTSCSYLGTMALLLISWAMHFLLFVVDDCSVSTGISIQSTRQLLSIFFLQLSPSALLNIMVEWQAIRALFCCSVLCHWSGHVFRNELVFAVFTAYTCGVSTLWVAFSFSK